MGSLIPNANANKVYLIVLLLFIVVVMRLFIGFGLNVFKAISKNTEMIRKINDVIHSFLFFLITPTIIAIKKTMGRQSNKIINKLPKEISEVDVIILINIVKFICFLLIWLFGVAPFIIVGSGLHSLKKA